MANRFKKFKDGFDDDQISANDNKKKKRQRGRKDNNDQNELNEILAAADNKNRLEQASTTQGKGLEKDDMVSTKPLEQAITETTSQVSQEAEMVLDSKPNFDVEIEPIDAAVLEQNTDSIVGLETTTQEAIAKVTEIPSTTSPVESPIILEETIDVNINVIEKERRMEIDNFLKKIWSGISELYTLINLNEKVADQKLLDDYFDKVHNYYNLEYQGLKKKLGSREDIKKINISDLKRFLRDVSSDYKKLYKTLEKTEPNFIKPKEASSQAEKPTLSTKSPNNNEIVTSEKKLPTLQEWSLNRRNLIISLDEKAPPNLSDADYDLWYKENVEPKVIDWEEENPRPLTNPTIVNELEDANNNNLVDHNISPKLINQEVTKILPTPTEKPKSKIPPKKTQKNTPEKKPLTLKEWQNNRANYIKSLEKKAQMDPEDNSGRYAKWYKTTVEPKLEEWEKRNPKPGESPLTEADYEKMMAEAEKTAEPEITPTTSPEEDKDNENPQDQESPNSGIPPENVPPEIPEIEAGLNEPAPTENINIDDPDNILFNPEDISAEEPPIPPAERNTVIRNISNQGILREKISQEHPDLTDDQIIELAKNQADFVKANLVEKLIIKDNDKIKKIFNPEGKKLNQKELKQELLKNLLDKSSLDSQKKLKLLARQISEATGLSMEEAESCIANQEQHLRDQALTEINAGRTAGATAEEAEANAKAGRKKKIGWALAKSVAYIGGGALLTGATGGIGAIAALTGVRIIDRVITDRLQKRKVDAKFAEMKAQLESDPNNQDTFLKGFFAEVSVAQQKRISGEHNFDFEGFADINPDLLAGYEANEQEQIIKALEALQRIDEINYNRERDLLERLGDKIKKSDNRALQFMEGIATGFNKFMVKGGENTYERAVSAAMFGGAAIAAREMPMVRNLMLAMAGWKMGDFAGRMIWGNEKQEVGKVDDQDTAQDILDMMAVMEENKTSDKHKRLLLKAGTSMFFALTPMIVNQVLNNWPVSETRASETGVETPTTTETVKTSSETITPNEIVETPKVNPLTEAITEMKGVHGQESSHLWGLIDKKVDVMTDHLKGIEDIKTMAGSEGQMTHIIDNIKDQITKNPQDFGLLKGTDIDFLTSTDLEKISQNEHFNDLIAGMFKEGSFADQAQNLSAEAIRNIEANNDYYQDVASHLEGVKLDQEAYDAMDRMQNQGLSAEAAASALQKPSAGVAQSVIEQSGVIRSEDLADSIPAGTPETTTLSAFSENFQNDSTKQEWLRTLESMKDDNKHAVGKSLDAIFRKLGLTESYSDPNTANFIIKNPGYREGILSFEVPAPIEHQLADQIDSFHFSYDPSKHEIVGYVADETVILKNVKNVDESLKAVFNDLTKRVTR